MAIHMANKYVKFSKGMVEDLLVNVDKFIFPVDFLILDMKEDEQVPIMLGGPFLNTAKVLFHIYEKTLTLRVGKEELTFGIDKEIKYAKTYDEAY